MKQFDLPLFVSNLFNPAPRKDASEGTLRTVQLAAGALPYRLVRRRRRSIALTVDHDGITAAAPRWVTLREIEGFIRIKEGWLRRRLAEAVHPEHFEWRAGARLAWLGGEVELCPVPGAGPARLDGDRLMLDLPPDAPAEALRAVTVAWMRNEVLALFRERAALLAPQLGVEVPPIRLSNSKSQWGSCSASGRILLCWRLAHLPLRLVDYVVAHELAHLVQLNHSRRFWTLVERLCPDYLEARKELNLCGRRLPLL